MKFCKYRILVLLFCLGSIALNAQKSAPKVVDNQLWLGVEFRKELNDKFRVDIEQQTRLNNNWKDVKATFFEVGIRYKPLSFLVIKPQFRYLWMVNNRNRYRISVDATTRYKFDAMPLKLYYRARFQNATVVYTGEHITALRNLVGAEYKLAKWITPYAETEWFYRFNSKNEFRVFRYTFGAELRLNKNMDVKVYFQSDAERNVKIPVQQNVVGIKMKVNM